MNDTLLAGFFTIVGVLVGVLLTRWAKTEERKEVKVERIVQIALRISNQYGTLLRHLAVNEKRLSLILAENLEGKSPSKADFRGMIDDALLAYPLPDLDRITVAAEDSLGYGLAALSDLMNDYVREANAAANDLKSGKQDSFHVSKFLVMNDRISKDQILSLAGKQLRAYLEALELMYGRKLNLEKDDGVETMVKDLEKTYATALEMGKAIIGYQRTAEEYLKKIGWQ